MTGSIRIFEKLNFTPKLSALAFLKVKLPNMTDWHNHIRKFLSERSSSLLAVVVSDVEVPEVSSVG